MKVIGFRSSTKCVRYAIVDTDWPSGELLNTDTESRLLYPPDMDNIEERLVWVSNEIERIFHQTRDIDKAVIKAHEYAGTEKKAKRETNYTDAIIALACAKANVPVALKIYSSLSTTSAKVLEHAEQRVGRTDTHWDKQMADAVVAAWSGGK